MQNWPFWMESRRTEKLPKTIEHNECRHGSMQMKVESSNSSQNHWMLAIASLYEASKPLDNFKGSEMGASWTDCKTEGNRKQLVKFCCIRLNRSFYIEVETQVEKGYNMRAPSEQFICGTGQKVEWTTSQSGLGKKALPFAFKSTWWCLLWDLPSCRNCWCPTLRTTVAELNSSVARVAQSFNNDKNTDFLDKTALGHRRKGIGELFAS